MTNEEDRLRQMLDAIYRDARQRAAPIIARLVELESLKPSRPLDELMKLTPEQIAAIKNKI